MCESHVSDKLGWCPVSDSNFSESFKSGNVIKWTRCLRYVSPRGENKSRVAREALTLIFHNPPQYYKRGKQKVISGHISEDWTSKGTSDCQYCLTPNFNNSYYSRV